MADFEMFEIADFGLQSGTVLPSARLAYRTHGTLNNDGSNAIVYCTHFGGTHNECQFPIGPGKPLDPDKYFIVLTNLTGNGLSSSPSNTPAPFDGPRFPVMTILDNVRLQKRLTDTLDITRVALVLGHSMGALQCFEWGAAYPDAVERLAPVCGAARISDHNTAFLKGMQAILRCDPVFENGHYDKPPVRGLGAVGRAWSPWAPSQGFYREKAYQALGYDSVEAFLRDYWEKTFQSFDANNMMSQISTWLHADIGANPVYGGSFERALSAISAAAIVMPGSDDTYFPPEDSAAEVAHMPNAQLRPIPSSWGHWAGSGRNPADNAFIEEALFELLSRPV